MKISFILTFTHRFAVRRVLRIFFHPERDRLIQVLFAVFPEGLRVHHHRARIVI